MWVSHSLASCYMLISVFTHGNDLTAAVCLVSHIACEHQHVEHTLHFGWCSGWKTRLASLGKAVQGSMPGFMTAPAITHANKTDATMANSPVQAREVDQEGRSTPATDAAPAPPKAEAESVMSVSLEEAAELPPVTLMSSTADIIVPW